MLSVFTLAATGMAARPDRTRATMVVAASVEITLQNKCTRDVKYTATYNGKASQGVVAKGDKIKLTLSAGTTITVDGEEFMTVADSDNGQTFQVCR